MKKNIDPWYNTEGLNSFNYISIALLGACNMRCVFCYVDGDRPGLLKPNQVIDIIKQSYDMGMRKIQLSGGEPLLYAHLEEILIYLRKLDIEILLATNATEITPRIALLLANYKVKVGVSLETINERISDELSGVIGSHEKKLAGIDNLIDVGYTKDAELPLNIIIKTLKQNFNSFIDTWKWAKKKGIQPILDRAIPGNRCKIEWIISPSELRFLLDEVGKIEGIYHKIPFVNNEGCNRMGSSVHIDVDGSVFPCGGLPVSMGNIKTKNLSEIWTNSELAKQLKNYKTMISGSCKTCNESSICCGCRAVAYATTGNLFGPDTLCWNYKI